MRARGLTYAAALAVTLLAAPAQALRPDKSLSQCSIQVWDVKNGLPGAAIRALAQSSDGALWVATLGGVVRYDGTGFAAVPVPDALRGIAGETNKILAARDGRVWLGSSFQPPLAFSDGALRKLGPDTGLPDGVIPTAWAEGPRGEIWVASARGLHHFADGRFSPHHLGVENRGPVTLAVDATGTVWMAAATTGLWRVSGAELVPEPKLTGVPISALHLDRRGLLWVATAGRLVGLDGARTIAQVNDRALAGPVSQIADDEDGNLWLATPTGLLRVREGRVERFGVADGLPDAGVTAVLVDREGSLWIGSRSGGLAQITDRTLDTTGLPPALEGTRIHSVCQASDGALWFGTQGRGALRWKDGQSTSYGKSEGLPGDVVYAVAPGGDGEVWLGTHGGLGHWRDGKVTTSSLWSRPVRALYRGPGGALWIGGDGEVGRLAGGTLERFGAAQGMLPGQVRAMAEDGRGQLWVSAVGGLVRLEGGKLVRTSPTPGRRSGFVRAMLTDHQGDLWLATTEAGLVRIKDGRPAVFDATAGLDEGVLYQLLEDDEGDLWTATSRSVARVSRASLEAVSAGRRPSVEVMSFEATDRHAGVVAETIRQPAAWKARDGRLWFVTQHGMASVTPGRVRSNGLAPTAVLEAVLADGHDVLAAGGRFELPAGARKVDFQYRATALLQPARVRYRYRLEGRDADWVQAGARRTASYPELPAGGWRFRVQASNNDGLWSEQEAAFSFTVGVPFYRRFWFYGLCGLGLLPVFGLLHRVRVLRLRAQYLGIITERARVARELHDTILHGLTAVAMRLIAHRARLKAGATGTEPEVAAIQDEVARCLQDTRRAVRGLRASDHEEEGLGRLGLALGRLGGRLRDSSTVACEVKVEGTPRSLPHSVEGELYRIAQEAMTNAIKHAGATRIEARLDYRPETIVLQVSDDGRGFDPAHVPAEPGQHFGLVGMQERARGIGGTLSIRSSGDAGTTIELVMSAHG